jgi:regulator of protease activity HflC (stomatin/prohibitin superfamily)
MDEELKKTMYGVGIVVFLIILVLFNPVKFIGAGESGVVFNRFLGMTDRRLEQGFNLINPITDSVKVYGLKVRVTDYPEIDGMSSDNQTIKLHIAINWKYQPDHLSDIYTKIVGNIEDTVMLNIVNEVIKANLGKVQIGEIAKNREGLRIAIEKNLKIRMSEYYVDIVNLSIVNVDYSADFEKAVENKQVAQQQAQQAEYEKQAAIAKAEGQARSNQLLQQNATKAVIELKLIEKWNGVLPTTMTGDKSSILLSIAGSK